MDRAIRPILLVRQEGSRMNSPPPAMSGCASLATCRYLSLTSVSSLHAH
ncbi:hypothetical protein GQ55_1G371900 [Panicum hallii var. hallii]|uniref:Uncharacterized protein n=1 Tax=Panicum hallii var. hallii TaxID=1504633 RepID=A0A2T7FBI8_9POAL|nr:hypothetical protein GQ55_1G371900 [Panicum hallii var. hallii]